MSKNAKFRPLGYARRVKETHNSHPNLAKLKQKLNIFQSPRFLKSKNLLVKLAVLHRRSSQPRILIKPMENPDGPNKIAELTCNSLVAFGFRVGYIRADSGLASPLKRGGSKKTIISNKDHRYETPHHYSSIAHNLQHSKRSKFYPNTFSQYWSLSNRPL